MGLRGFSEMLVATYKLHDVTSHKTAILNDFTIFLTNIYSDKDYIIV
jgi:hypothetical protein